MSKVCEFHSGERHAQQSASHRLGIAITRAEAVHTRHSRRLSLSLLGASVVIGTSCLLIANS